MKFIWLAAISTTLILGSTPVLSQDESPPPEITPEATPEASPTTTFEIPPEIPSETPPPEVDPAVEPPPPVTGEPLPEEGSEYDHTEEGEVYNVIPHIPEDCSDIRIFSARGSDEPYPGRGGGMLGVLCSLFEETGVSCDYEDVVYPANTSYSGIFCQSANIGANAGQAQMTEYVQRCPDSRLVLTGYSQGGGVVGDILGGGGGFLFGCDQPSNPPLSRNTAPGSNSKSLQSSLAIYEVLTYRSCRRCNIWRTSLHHKPIIQHRTRVDLQWSSGTSRTATRRPQRIRRHLGNVVQCGRSRVCRWQ